MMMHCEFENNARLAQLRQSYEAQSIYVAQAAHASALARANMLLARENELLMEAREKQAEALSLRLQAQGPPGLDKKAASERPYGKKVLTDQQRCPPGLSFSTVASDTDYIDLGLEEESLVPEEPLIMAPPGLETETRSGLPHATPEVHPTEPKFIALNKLSLETSAYVEQLNSPRGSEASTSASSKNTPAHADLDNDNECSSGESHAPEESVFAPGTSLMMRNLPNNYTRDMLLQLLEIEGFQGSFDFIYLPTDFRRQNLSHLGYAFLNCLSVHVAEEFRQHFSGFNRWCMASDKVCEVTSSSLQGLEEHIEHFRNSPVMHKSVPDEHKPAVFAGSERVSFPTPTRRIQKLRSHCQREGAKKQPLSGSGKC